MCILFYTQKVRLFLGHTLYVEPGVVHEPIHYNHYKLSKFIGFFFYFAKISYMLSDIFCIKSTGMVCGS